MAFTALYQLVMGCIYFKNVNELLVIEKIPILNPSPSITGLQSILKLTLSS